MIIQMQSVPKLLQVTVSLQYNDWRYFNFRIELPNKKRKWKPPKKEMSKKPKKSKIQPNLEDLAMELLKN